MLKAVGVSHHYGTETLFSDVEFVLNPGDRVGLVGPNGVGKSTLVRILVGDLRPATGSVLRSPGTTVGYFAQQVPDPAVTVAEYLRASLGEVADLETRLTALEMALRRPGVPDAAALREYGEVQQRWADLAGWTTASRVAAVRQRLDIAHLADDMPLAHVSGGEQARVTLAGVLLGEPDILVLDEPTNHLDAEGVAWLGEWLAEFRGAVLLVSHDRALLDQVAQRIVELDGIHDAPQWYDGGYTAYQVEKEHRWQRYLLDYEAQEKKRVRWEADIARTKEQARGVETTVRKGPGADQLRRYAKKVAKKAKVRERLLRRQLDAARWLAEPQTRPVLTLAFPAAGDGRIEAKGIRVEAGGRTIVDVDSCEVGGTDRVLLAGRNGSGKSTLLAVLAGLRIPDAGEVSGTGAVALLPQTHDALRTSTTVLDYFRSRVPVYVDEAEALLRAYLFDDELWSAPLRTLSAGELRRLLLAVMVNGETEVLLLDEPTNYLDFASLEVVEEALRAYRGAIVMVTHDARFAAALTPTATWTLTGTAE